MKINTPGLNGIKTIEDLDIAVKRVFIRLDLNVPLKGEGSTIEIADDTRIRGALPTLKYALGMKSKIVVASHLGRPKDKPGDREKFSLAPVGQRLSELLNLEVILFEDLEGEGLKGMLSGLSDKQILLLENTRFAPGEEKDSTELASHLASFTDVYIDDAFGAIHRAHCTVHALPALIQQKGVGFLIQKEVQMLDKLLHQTQRPFVAIIGGAKVSDKIGVIDNLLEKVDVFVIGGAMAFTFLKAQNIAVGRSLVEQDKIHLAQDLLGRLKARGKTLILPVDHVIASDLKERVATQTTPTAAVPEGMMGLDVGPKTLALIEDVLKKAKTIFWNGPMGAFETKPFHEGTFAVAQMLATSSAITVVGGGDSVTAVEEAGLTDKMTHISTGGGASLEYLEGKDLPGLSVLRASATDKQNLTIPVEEEFKDVDDLGNLVNHRVKMYREKEQEMKALRPPTPKATGVRRFAKKSDES